MKHFHFVLSLSLHLTLSFAVWLGTRSSMPNKEIVEIITLTQFQNDSKESKQKVTTHKEKKTEISLKKTSKNLQEEHSVPTGETFKNSLSQPLDDASSLQPTKEIAKNQSPVVGQTNLETILKGRAPKNSTESYLATLRDRIASQQVYPHHSRIFREEGVVNLKMTVQKDGSLIKIEIIQPSPHKRLNDTALRAITKAAPFSKFPPEIVYDHWIITLPVRFTLTRNHGQKSG